VRIGFVESGLRESAKAAKGRWDPEKKLWFVQYGRIKGTVLEKHIVLDAKYRLDNNWLVSQEEIKNEKKHYWSCCNRYRLLCLVARMP
jgi:hypothetical protein